MVWSVIRRACVYSLVLWVALLHAASSQAQTLVIYEDDFEGAVSGWTDNDTDFDPDVTNFLGRFSAGQTSTTRVFTTPAGADEIIIAFDLYRFDSWDNSATFGFDRFEIDIDGVEIFSLPFPNPQDARSGTTGNVDWSHTPLTGREELAFVSGEFWFDQLHRFEVIVDNPGTAVSLTLRVNLSQGENDESGGVDNFLVTAGVPGNDIAAVAETFPAIDGTAGGTTTSVLSSDTINGVILNPNDVTIISASSSSPDVTLNTSTGLITVAANTAAGTYTAEYEVCENINLPNCSTVTETVVVFVPGGSGGGFCPAGTTSVSGPHHALTASGGQNAGAAIGAPMAEGATGTDGNSGRTFFPSIIYDLTGAADILVPEGTVVQVSLGSHFGSNAQIAVSGSLDDSNFPAIGSSDSLTVSLNSTNNILSYFDYEIPAGGARYMELDHITGGIRFDGVIFDTLCTPPPVVLVEAEDDSGTVADSSLGNSAVFNVIDNDEIDGVVPTVFDLSLAAGEVLPPELTFDLASGAVEVLQDAASGNYSFQYEVCQAGLATNCDIATVSIDVTNPNPPSICPAGTVQTAGTFHVVGVTPVNGTPTNPDGAIGEPLLEGSQDNNSSVTGVTFFQSLIYDLTGDPDVIVPRDTVIDVSFANHFNSNPSANISTSLDDVTYTAVGSTGPPWDDNNGFRYDQYTVPAGGARYLQVEYVPNSGGLRFDGVIYNTQCQLGGGGTADLTANKSVAVYDPQDQGLYAIPGNDVIYTFTIENLGTGEVDSGSLMLIDNMPDELTFYNGDIDDAGPETDPVSFADTAGNLTFDYGVDAAFSDGASAPTSFADCDYTPAAGYDPDVNFICLNPKGVMAGGSTLTLSFRARIE